MGSSAKRHFFPLTSLQIGDLQSYLAQLTIFVCPDSKRFFILLDNRPWLIDQQTKPAHLWQLMVTKSRLSPFANTRARRKRSENGKKFTFSNSPRSTPIMKNKSTRWYSLIDEAMRQKKTLLQVNKLKDSRLLNKELHRTLYGFIIFEVDWADVRGINYLNELQTDTSLALEAKIMRRWEFDSVEQVSSLLGSWFSGSVNERRLLREYLNSISSQCRSDVFYDAQEDIIRPEWDYEKIQTIDHDSGCTESFGEESGSMSSFYTPPPSSGPYKRRKIVRSEAGSTMSEESYSEILTSPRSSTCSSWSSDSDSAKTPFEPSTYRDVLILFRFDDHDLPFKLKDVILSDVRLLTLLEYGLPSWVIFLQSYPVFCKIYRPWMCPLARALYVLMSIVTVLIGFYDLYKNVPMLKATASRLFGPFFDWIETWEMISRLKYLGTMLFLHNFQQAFTWALKIVRASKSALSVLTKPVVGPVLEVLEFTLPFWNFCAETVGYISSAIMITLGTTSSLITGTLQIIASPFWFVFSIVLNIANSIVCPIIWVLGEILGAPFRLVVVLASFVINLFVNIINLLRQTLSIVSSVFQVYSASKSSAVTYEASIWRSLWKDLLYQVFRAVRSILYGFVAFFSTCNRHRLSISNHIQVFLRRLSRLLTGARCSHEGGLKYATQRPLRKPRRDEGGLSNELPNDPN